MAKKVKVFLEPTVQRMEHVFDLEDLNVTEEEWNEMTIDEKLDRLGDEINNLPEQPSWGLIDHTEY